ncbi:MAG: TonB-dependent receptor [Porticoccaceae bacterium]
MRLQRTPRRRPFPTTGIAALALLTMDMITASPLLAQPAAGFAGLEEIVVTARKREESLQEVPISIGALNSDELRVKGVTKPEDLKFHVPGVEIRQNVLRNAITYFIRGQGQTYSSSPSVVTYFAGAPLDNGGSGGSSIGNNAQMFDLASVQVLKGPQGTLFGRSSTGGAILFTPQRPTDEFGGFLEQTLGEYNWRETSGALNVPLIEGVLSARLAANIVRRDGFTKTLNTGQTLDDRSRDSYRLGIEFTPTDWLNSYLMYTHNKADENNTGAVLYNFNENFPIYDTTPGTGAGWGAIQGLCGALNPGNAGGAQACAAQRLGILNTLRDGLLAEQERVDSGGDSAKRRNLAGAELILKGKNEQLLNITTLELGPVAFLGDVTVKNIFSTVRNLGARTTYDGGNPLPNGLVYNNFGFENFRPVASSAASGRKDWLDDYSEEFQVMGDIDGRHSWIVGYYQEVQRNDLLYPALFATFGNIFSPTFSPTVVGGFPTNQKNEQKGYFAQTTFDLSEWVLDGLKLTTGYRWTESTGTRAQIPVDQVELMTNGNLVPGGTVVKLPGVDDSAPSWTVSLDYQMNDDTLVYLAHRRGFKPGGTNTSSSDPSNPLPGFVAQYDPEIVDDVELGVKADWALGGMPVRSNAAIYKMWYEDIQRSESIGDEFGAPTTQVNNIAKAEIQGLELSTQILLTDRLELSLTYSYIDAKYKEWPGFVTNVITGEQLPYIDSPYVGTPENQGTIAIRYALPVPAEWGEMTLAADYYRQSSVWLNDTALEDGFGKEDGYGNLNLRADWSNVFNTAFDLAFFVRNATDDIHAVALNSYYAFVGTAYAVYSEPRMWGAQVRYRFGAQ